ncbi:DUF6626 family protein [Devosia sp. SD17-2]|uniref:DUF6626 family protein n=1 Tax=Devosia sp. SD17-2 TaxID=2976459 RepID=UPI0023D8889D|nr:DUF6626 family protein [Devosia sp. SD17-2]WEJ32835.1 hypothetical protein NYQ88_18465 [Devosia sp. SD17-2]
MMLGIEFLELLYGQLHEAGIIRSKSEFSERLLGKSPSYLTSMRAKQRVVSSEVIMVLGDNLVAEIADLATDPAHIEICALLRRAVAQVNNYLADQTIPAGIISMPRIATPLGSRGRLTAWLRMMVGISS